MSKVAKLINALSLPQIPAKVYNEDPEMAKFYEDLFTVLRQTTGKLTGSNIITTIEQTETEAGQGFLKSAIAWFNITQSNASGKFYINSSINYFGRDIWILPYQNTDTNATDALTDSWDFSDFTPPTTDGIWKVMLNVDSQGLQNNGTTYSNLVGFLGPDQGSNVYFARFTTNGQSTANTTLDLYFEAGTGYPYITNIQHTSSNPVQIVISMWGSARRSGPTYNI